MGLRKSQEGIYEDINKQDKAAAREQLVDNLVNQAKFVTG